MINTTTNSVYAVESEVRGSKKITNPWYKIKGQIVEENLNFGGCWLSNQALRNTQNNSYFEECCNLQTVT